MWKIETERTELFDVNMLITIEIHAAGFAERENVIRAFHKAVVAFEILNTKIVIDNSGNAFYTVNKNHQNMVSFTDKPLQELINEQEKNRFKIEDGEYLRLFASVNGQDNNRFIFMLHHLGGDGKSLLYFIEAFFRSLNNEELEFQKIKLLNADTLPPDSKLPFFARALINYYNRKWKKEKRIFTFEDMNNAFCDFWKSHRTNVNIDTMNTAELSQILKECKKMNIGYTSYDIATRIKNSAKTQDIGLAVDARADKNRTMSNQATGISVKYKYDRKKSFADNAKKINLLMKKKLNNNTYRYFVLRFMSLLDPTLVDAVNLEFAGYFHSNTSKKLAALLGYGTNTKDISITNLTKADIPTEYGHFKIKKAAFVPPVVSYGKNIIGIITINNNLIQTAHCYDNQCL